MIELKSDSELLRPLLVFCKRCRAPNDEFRRRDGRTRGLSVYRCGYCGTRFNELREVGEKE